MKEIESISLKELINNTNSISRTILKDDLLLIFEDDLLLINRSIRITDTAKPFMRLPARLDAIACYLCKNGEVSLSLNYTDYHLKKGMMLLTNSLHVIDKICVKDSFEGYIIVISRKIAKSIVDNIQNIDTIESANSYQQATTELYDTEMQSLIAVIERIIKIMSNSSHPFQKNIILNEISNLLLEIAGIRVIRNKKQTETIKTANNEEVVRDFIRLVITRCKEQHEVLFYANKLCMTPGNLSRIMKAFSGKTAYQWINDALITESKILLHKPDNAIQQVADELNFADQSSFGKFFRKHTGLTPREYRKSV